MIKTFFAFLLLSFNSDNTAATFMKNETESILEIDFQDFFKSDMITLKLNNCIIFENASLVSNKSTGLTDARLKVYWNGKEGFKIIYKGNPIICKPAQKEITLLVSVNGKESKYFIDLKKGKYIGFSKKGDHDLLLSQSPSAFQYD
jgi:hypothetical protein